MVWQCKQNAENEVQRQNEIEKANWKICLDRQNFVVVEGKKMNK